MYIWIYTLYRVPHNKAASHVMSHVPSIEEMQYMDVPYTQMEDCQRTGIMAAFSRFEEFESYFDELMDQFFEDSPPDSPGAMGDNDEVGGRGGMSVSISSSFGDGTTTAGDYEPKAR
jgi:hypothetical protein